ncbi:MAG: hypothetical protein WA981_03715 [Glaciecola sp.]
MKTLAEFDTLQAAKEYPQTRGKMIHRNSMNAWLSQAGKYRRMKEIAADTSSPLGDGAAAFLDSTEYNLIQTSETGQGVIQLMQALITAEGNDPALQAVLDKGITAANEIYYPHAGATEYDFKRAKGLPIAQKEAIPVNGYIKITLTQDVEPHRPQVYVDIQGVKQRITSFGLVDKAGGYLAQVPRGYASFYVDDAYGVIA